MPSTTFFRLNENKKKKLIDASFKEFSLNNFNDVSINRIIREANIPRGSFYMYFEDKKDLYFYLLEKYYEMIINYMKEDLLENNGDLFLMFQNNIKRLHTSFTHDEINFLKRVIENITILEESKKTFGFKDNRLFTELLPNINKKLLTDNAKKHLSLVFALNMHLLMVTFMKILREDGCEVDIINDYYEHLNILKYGCVKE